MPCAAPAVGRSAPTWASAPRNSRSAIPDLTVDCGAPGDKPFDQVLGNPVIVVKVLSSTIRDYDLRTKKDAYREIASIRTIAFVDPDEKTLSVRPRIDGGWIDTLFAAADLALPHLDIVVPHAEIFTTTEARRSVNHS